MAEVKDNGPFTDALSAISQGKRHLLVRDYPAAVTAFAEALELLSGKHGDCADELGEPYLLYGRALLGLAREDAGILGGGVPGSNDLEEVKEESEGDDEDEEEEENDDETDEKQADDEKVNGEKDEKMEAEEDKTEKEKEPEKEKVDEDKKEKEAKKEKVEEDKKEKEAEKEKVEEEKKGEEDKSKESTNGTAENKSGPSKENVNNEGESENNSAEEEGEDVNKEDEDEEDPGRGLDLQVAWEVLELAKIVFEKRGDSGLKQLAETHRLLGEVAMESGNHQVALSDLERAIKILEDVEPSDPRAIAELHYQLGLAYSLLNEFDASIKEFNEATVLLNSRIKELENTSEPPKKDDPFYTIEGEIKELKELLPEIQDKIADMKDFKDETRKLMIESIKNKTSMSNNGAGPSSAGTSSSSDVQTSPKEVKPASDISHLIRKKRKTDNSESSEEPPCKKQIP